MSKEFKFRLLRMRVGAVSMTSVRDWRLSDSKDKCHMQGWNQRTLQYWRKGIWTRPHCVELCSLKFPLLYRALIWRTVMYLLWWACKKKGLQDYANGSLQNNVAIIETTSAKYKQMGITSGATPPEFYLNGETRQWPDCCGNSTVESIATGEPASKITMHNSGMRVACWSRNAGGIFVSGNWAQHKWF